MKDEIALSDNFNHIYNDINELIKRKNFKNLDQVEYISCRGKRGKNDGEK